MIMRYSNLTYLRLKKKNNCGDIITNFVIWRCFANLKTEPILRLIKSGSDLPAAHRNHPSTPHQAPDELPGNTRQICELLPGFAILELWKVSCNWFLCCLILEAAYWQRHSEYNQIFWLSCWSNFSSFETILLFRPSIVTAWVVAATVAVLSSIQISSVKGTRSPPSKQLVDDE